jgi:hypothetical protein
VNALHAYNGKLYAGLYSGYVYSWDGSSWTSCGQVSTSTTVTALAVHNGYLYAGCGSVQSFPESTAMMAALLGLGS